MAQKHIKRKKTVGQIAVEQQQKDPETRSPIEIQQEHEKEYLKNLLECVHTNAHKYANDFFVVVITKNEKLLYNVIRCYFFDRISCPTPDYDQTVFMIRRAQDELVHLWTIPNREACLTYMENKDKVVPEEYAILDNIIRFMNGDLFKLCKKLNHEEDESPHLVA